MSLVTISDAPFGAGAEPCFIEPDEALAAVLALEISLRGAAPSRAQWEAIYNLVRICLEGLYPADCEDEPLVSATVVPFPCSS